MNKVGLDNLEVNSYIDAPVFLDDAYIILSPDIPVSQELLTRLSSWHYTQVYTDGQPAEKPRNTGENAEESRLGFLKEDVHESAERQEVSSFYQQKVEEVRSIYSRFAEREELRIDEVTDIIKDIISTLKSSRRFLLSVPFISQPEEDYLASSCLKTAILSLAVGEFLKLPPHRLIEVGSAGLLHKIGMMKIPRNIYMSDRPLSPNERKNDLRPPHNRLQNTEGSSLSRHCRPGGAGTCGTRGRNRVSQETHQRQDIPLREDRGCGNSL